MRVEIRIYKRYDTNLLALYSAGYPIGRLMVDALIGYANNNPQFYFVDKIVPLDMNDKITVHFGITIPDKEQNVINMLKGIKHGFRNSFCKAILRNSLVFQNLSCYFADPQLMNLEAANMNWIQYMNIPNLHMLSEYSMRERQVKIADHVTNYQDVQNVPQVSNPNMQDSYPIGQNPYNPNMNMQGMPQFAQAQPMPAQMNAGKGRRIQNMQGIGMQGTQNMHVVQNAPNYPTPNIPQNIPNMGQQSVDMRNMESYSMPIMQNPQQPVMQQPIQQQPGIVPPVQQSVPQNTVQGQPEYVATPSIARQKADAIKREMRTWDAPKEDVSMDFGGQAIAPQVQQQIQEQRQEQVQRQGIDSTMLDTLKDLQENSQEFMQKQEEKITENSNLNEEKVGNEEAEYLMDMFDSL